MVTRNKAPRRPTMTDVAQAAGVSLKTVSRVVNGVTTVDPDMTERVLAAVAELGFRRNDMAANLRSGRTSASVGLLIEDLANPFYSTIAAAVAEVALDRDAMLLSASSEEDPDRERQLLLDMCERRVDGLLVVPTSIDHSFLRAEMQMGTPAVFLDRPPVGLRADTVVLDNARGARDGITHLLERGHERIGMLVDSLSIYTMRERLSSAEATLAAAGIPHDGALVRDDLHEPDATRRAIAEMLNLRRPPTALFCGNNRITIGAIQELWAQGNDAALVGFDDFETSHLMPRPVTIIGCDTRALGRKGAELLFRRIDGDTSRPTTVVIPTQLAECGIGQRTTL